MVGPDAIQTAVVTTALTEIARMTVSGFSVFGVKVENLGTTAFNACEVQAAINPSEPVNDDEWFVLASASGDYDGITPDPTTLAGNAITTVPDIRPASATHWRLMASVTSGTTNTRTTVSRLA